MKLRNIYIIFILSHLVKHYPYQHFSGREIDIVKKLLVDI